MTRFLWYLRGLVVALRVQNPPRHSGTIELADERDSALSPESNIMRTAPADPAISGEAGACAFIGDRR